MVAVAGVFEADRSAMKRHPLIPSHPPDRVPLDRATVEQMRVIVASGRSLNLDTQRLLAEGWLRKEEALRRIVESSRNTSPWARGIAKDALASRPQTEEEKAVAADLSVLLDQLKEVRTPCEAQNCGHSDAGLGHDVCGCYYDSGVRLEPCAVHGMLDSHRLVVALADVAAAADFIPPDCGICNGGVTIEDDWPDGLCPLCGEVRAALARLRLVLAGEEEA